MYLLRRPFGAGGSNLRPAIRFSRPKLARNLPPAVVNREVQN